MSEKVGAVATVFEKQKSSSYEMIKSFRTHNQNSSIVIITDGVVSNIDELCSEFNCKHYKSNKKIGYPGSAEINIPLNYLYRFFEASLQIEEKYFINLEPDCFVTGNITIPYVDYDCIINQDSTLQWIYYFYGNNKIRSRVIPEMIRFYKNYGVHKEPMHDKIMGGGGDVYNTKFAHTIYHEWNTFRDRALDIKKIYDLYCIDFVWVQDYIVSLQIPFYGTSKYGGISSEYMKNLTDLNLKDRVFHPYKKYYNNFV